jgi:hypothetical protein
MSERSRSVRFAAADLKRCRGGVAVQSALEAGLVIKQKVTENAVGG